MSPTTRGEAIAEVAAAGMRAARKGAAPAPPTHLRATRVTAYSVSLHWRPRRGVAKHTR